MPHAATGTAHAPLPAPAAVAAVGRAGRRVASAPGSLGRIVFENLLAGGFRGALYAVNPRHATVLGAPSRTARSPAIGAPVELAVIATPPAAVADVLERRCRPAT